MVWDTMVSKWGRVGNSNFPSNLKLTQNKKGTHDYILCHPRECGDPGSELSDWIPASAGMTDNII